MKIFQAYYKEEQRAHLDPEFTPFDNTANPVVNLHEYYIYTKIYEEAKKTNEDLWGHFSWQWKRKLEDVPASQILEIINLNPGADVYTFHPFPTEATLAWNVWEQGQWCHPHMIELAEHIFLGMGLDPKLIQTPMGTRDYLCANYFVGNDKFWTGLLDWMKRFVDVCQNLEPRYLELLNSSAGYEPNPALDYRGFICERLVSTFLVHNHDRLIVRPLIEVYKYRLDPNTGKLMSIKDQAIAEKDKNLLIDYLDKRKQGLRTQDKDWGQEWINSCVL